MKEKLRKKELTRKSKTERKRKQKKKDREMGIKNEDMGGMAEDGRRKLKRPLVYFSFSGKSVGSHCSASYFPRLSGRLIALSLVCPSRELTTRRPQTPPTICKLSVFPPKIYASHFTAAIILTHIFFFNFFFFSYLE